MYYCRTLIIIHKEKVARRLLLHIFDGIHLQESALRHNLSAFDVPC